MTCQANPGGIDNHTHGVVALDELTGAGQTDFSHGHSHPIVGFVALPAGYPAHTHAVTCEYDPGVQGGGGGIGCGF